MTKKYLVTGGTGFIGAAIMRRLIQENHEVICLDNFSRGAYRRIADIAQHIQMHEADIRNQDAVMKAAKGVDGVIHLAYVNGTKTFYEKPELVLDVGVRGMLNVLDACREYDIPELFLASSSEVYHMPEQIPSSETVPLIIPDVLNPRFSYGGGKIISELLTVNFGRKNFDRAIIFRPHNIYGPDMGWEHVVPQFISRALTLAEEQSDNLAFPIQGSGLETRAFTYIDDFVDGVMLLIDKGQHLNIYHIGNPEEITIRLVAEQIIAKIGLQAKLAPSDVAAGSTHRRCPDVGKLIKLGFQPKINFAQGLEKTLPWYIENQALCV